MSSQPAAPRRGKAKVAWRVLQLLFAFVIVPLILIVLLEFGLRLAGFGRSTQFLVRRTCKGEVLYAPNRAFYQQFFSLPINSGQWDQMEFQMAAVKPPGVCRVFIFGESAANGQPPDTACSFWRILESMLIARFPETRFEFCCLAMPGDNSHAMWVAAKACARLQPDLYVVYMGNNEVCGPFGPVSRMAHSRFWNIPVIRANIALSNLRIAQLVAGRRWQVHSRTDVRPQEVESYYANSFSPDDPLITQTYAHFRRNLEDICRLGTRAGAAVVLCTPGSNLRDWRPHVSEHRADLSPDAKTQWDALYQQGIQREEALAWRDALDRYQRAAALDDTYADLLFRMGTCHWGLEDYDAARSFFLRAQDRDFYPSYSNAEIVAIIQEVAAQRASRGVYLADSARELAASSPHAVTGREYFYDAVHCTFSGNYAVAAAVFAQLVRALPDAVRGPGASDPSTPTIAECEQRVARTPWVAREHLEVMTNMIQSAAWPAAKETAARLRQQEAELRGTLAPNAFQQTLAAYRQALAQNEHDYYLHERLVQGLMNVGEVEEALAQAQLLVTRFPLRRETHRLRGFAFLRAGRQHEAADEFRATLAVYPDDSESHFQLGHILQQEGELEQALHHCRECLRTDPDQTSAILSTAQILEQRGNIPAAREAYERAIATDPQFSLPYDDLDRLLTQRAPNEDRVSLWRKMIEVHSNAGFPHACLARALRDQGDLAGAVGAFRAALNLNANQDAVRLDLIRALCQSGDLTDAKEEAERCRGRGVALPADLTETLGTQPAAGPQRQP